MALTAANVLEVRTGSGVSDNNGAAFDPTSAGTDRSQQNSPQVAIDNSTITTSITTNVITFTGNTYTVLAGDVGNVVQMLTGTNVTPAFYRITSVSAGLNGSWTVDSNVVTSGTTTNATGNMGGALASPGKAAGAMVSGNVMWVASGTYTISSASANVAGGVVTLPTGVAANLTEMIGYGSSRGDGGTKPVLQAGTISSFTILTQSNADVHLENLTVDCNSKATSTGANVSANSVRLYKCKFMGATVRSATCTSSAQMIGCEATTCSSLSVASFPIMAYCWIHDNTGVGVIQNTTNNNSISNCLITNNTGASSDGLQLNGTCCLVLNNTIYGNGRDGIRITGNNTQLYTVANNIITNNGGFGVNATAVTDATKLYNNAFIANTSNQVNTTSAITAANVFGSITLTVSPYTNAAGNDFSLNNTAGGGASCRAAGLFGVIGGSGTTTSEDIGAAQSAGGSGSVQGFVYIRGR